MGIIPFRAAGRRPERKEARRRIAAFTAAWIGGRAPPMPDTGSTTARVALTPAEGEESPAPWSVVPVAGPGGRLATAGDTRKARRLRISKAVDDEADHGLDRRVERRMVVVAKLDP